MKNIFLSAVALVAFGTLVTSCKKDRVTEPIKNTLLELAADETPDAVVDSLGDYLDNPFVSDATDHMDVEIESVPEILFSDYFSFVETRTNKRDSMLKACSGAFRLARANRDELEKAHKAKMECMKDNRHMLHHIDSITKAWAAHKRQGLMEEHKREMDKIGAAFRAGSISERERDAQVAAARKRLDDSLAKLAGETREKLQASKDRAAAAGKIKDCERIYLRQVHEIIGKDNYALWIRCHKMHFRRKHR
jgi:hypothetical protein